MVIKGKDMNLKRITSSLMGFPIVAIILIFGNNIIVDIAFSIVGIIAIKEYFNAFSKKSNPVRWVGYLACIFIAFIHIIPMKYVLLSIGLSTTIIITILILQVIITNMKTNINDVAVTCFGIFYIVGFMIFIPMLHGIEYGKFFIWYILLAAWGTDIFAYAIGRRIGKHKLNPISPKKSIEGSIGGIIGSLVLALIYTFILNKFTQLNIEYWYISIVAIILSILGQIGDFAASSIKRYVEIKDFSDLIPGHRRDVRQNR